MFFEDIVFNHDNSNNVNLYSSKDGLILGNMFKDEFKGYKNYKPNKIIANSEKEELLLKIYEYDFALNDLSLWLDIHPDDNKIYNYFRKYTEELRELVKLYESKYGPMELDFSDYEKYQWYKGKWPFEGVDL